MPCRRCAKRRGRRGAAGWVRPGRPPAPRRSFTRDERDEEGPEREPGLAGEEPEEGRGDVPQVEQRQRRVARHVEEAAAVKQRHAARLREGGRQSGGVQQRHEGGRAQAATCSRQGRRAAAARWDRSVPRCGAACLAAHMCGERDVPRRLPVWGGWGRGHFGAASMGGCSSRRCVITSMGWEISESIRLSCAYVAMALTGSGGARLDGRLSAQAARASRPPLIRTSSWKIFQIEHHFIDQKPIKPVLACRSRWTVVAHARCWWVKECGASGLRGKWLTACCLHVAYNMHTVN